MDTLFLRLANMSFSAGWLIGAVVLIRLLFKKAPKWIYCLLWGLVALRLILPFSFESKISLIPSTEVIPESSILSTAPVIDTGIEPVDNAVNPIIAESLAPNPGDSANPLQVILGIASYLWIVGIAVLLLYSFISWLKLKFQVRIRLRYRDNIYFCDQIDSPFILGVLRPKIYIPSGFTEEQQAHIIAHEKAHLKRLDHCWKPIGFALLAVYWFNPLIWIAYILLCRDIEGACDEKVIRDMDGSAKKGYSEALIACNTHRRKILVCPLAFGEVGVKERIRSVLNYKKPAFWILVASIMISVTVAVCFLSDPWQNTMTISAVQKATAARTTLKHAFGQYEEKDFSSEYILDCYIGEDYKLHILIRETARDIEPMLDQVLENHRRYVIYEYTDLTEASLKAAAKNLGDILIAQGYPVAETGAQFSKRRMLIYMEDVELLLAASRWVKDQNGYPFDIPYTDLRFVLKDGKERRWPEYSEFIDYTQESFHKSEAAVDVLLAYLKEAGGYYVYREFYNGYHIGTDNLLHIYFLPSASDEQRKSLEAAMHEFADVIVLEDGGFTEEELWSYFDDLHGRLTELGLVTAGGGIHHGDYLHGSDHVHLGIVWEDIPIAMSLMGENNPYPFGNTPIPVIFEQGGYVQTFGPEMPPVTENTDAQPQEQDPAESKSYRTYLRGNSSYRSYQDPIDTITSAIKNMISFPSGISGKVVSIEYEAEKTAKRISEVLKNGLFDHSEEYMEENFKVYTVIFDQRNFEDYPIKPLPSGRYKQIFQLCRDDPESDFWTIIMISTPEYIQELEESEPEEPVKDEITLPEMPIVIKHSRWNYESFATAEETAQNAIIQLKNSSKVTAIEILNVESSDLLTQLNVFWPVDQFRLDAYGYDRKFLTEHFKTVTVRYTWDNEVRVCFFKMVEHPDTGMWEVWDGLVWLDEQ